MTTNIDIFENIDYKVFLKKKIKFESIKAKGVRQKLTDHMGCQPSYLSQVLNGKPHLTLEQAQRFCQFFSFNKVETKYLILLVEYARAGVKELRDFFKEQIEEIRDSRFNLKKRFSNTEEITREDQHKYYSAWFYSAIHVALSIPTLQDPQKLAVHFNLPIELVLEAIEFLEHTGLIQKIEGRYEFTKRHLHLERESVFIQRHHINWRSQSLQSVEKNLKEDMHYSNVIAIAKADYKKIKEEFVAAIERARGIIRPSKEEALYALTLDIFEL